MKIRIAVAVMVSACSGARPPTSTGTTAPLTGHVAVRTAPKDSAAPQAAAIDFMKVEQERLVAVDEIVPSNSMCLPKRLENDPQIRIALSHAGTFYPIIHAIDHDPSRLMGTVATWSLRRDSGKLNKGGGPYEPRGLGVMVPLDGRCAPLRRDNTVERVCIPESAAMPRARHALIATNQHTADIALVVAGSGIHLFDRKGTWKRSLPLTVAEPTDIALTVGIIAIRSEQKTVVIATGDHEPEAPLPEGESYVGEDDPAGTEEASMDGPATLSMWSERSIAIADAATREIEIVSDEEGTQTYYRTEPQTACSAKDVNALIADPTTGVSNACRKDYTKKIAPWMGAMMMESDGDEELNLVLLRGVRTGEIALVDREFREMGTLRMKWCAN